MHQFFDRQPYPVARELIGKTLRIGRKQSVILDTLPLTEHNNYYWLDRRPLFGADPVDAYAAPYRGSSLLFLRTGQRNTCVRIESISIGGEEFSSAGQVCKAFELEDEKSGWVSYDGQVVQVRWL